MLQVEIVPQERNVKPELKPKSTKPSTALHDIMVQYFDKIPDFLFSWIDKQKVFWVATAPLTANGLVNISPKGTVGSFRVVNANKVWYEDLTGSGESLDNLCHTNAHDRPSLLLT